MAQLSRDEFDALEFGAARTGDHRDAALQMSQLVSAGTQPASTQPASTEPTGTEPTGTEPTGTEPTGTEPTGTGPTSAHPAGMTLAEARLRAGEQWLLADDPAAAADCFRQALQDSGGSFVDARVALARALYLLGDTDEARKLVDQLDADGRTDPRKCDLVAELLVEQSDLIGALDWANTGVELCLAAAGQPGAFVPRQLPPDVDQTELRMLLSLRYRIRNDMGLDEDEYDKLLDEL